MLTVRRPVYLWSALALLVASLVHALVWFAARLFAAQAAHGLDEAMRQMGQSVFWMVCALALWLIQTPRSRVTAMAQVLGCALLVCVVGSVMAFNNLTSTQNFEFSLNNMLIFTVVAVPMIALQLILALPSAALFQQLLLMHPPRPAPEAQVAG
ncbi:MAG: hypothetical protein QM667_02040 [Asticcacaulis sp.]